MTAAGSTAQGRGDRHFGRLLAIWLGLSVVITPLAVIFVGPLFPPGGMSGQSAAQTTDDTVLLGTAVPVMLLVLVVLGYALVAFRDRGAALEGPAVRGNRRLTVVWLAVNVAITLALAAYGTVRLAANGAGGGQGPNPAFAPSGPVLPVQVIAQQWEFTYRYPTYGGLETPQLELPVGETIEFHVTSLDVVHSFWAYQLGVKADANPGYDNIAYATPRHTGSFDVRCAELCGLWHGWMYGTGRVVTRAQFASWIAAQAAYYAPVAHSLPPYSTSYLPAPQRRGG